MIDLKTLEIIVSLAVVMLGCTWRLSAKIAKVETIASLARDELVQHSTTDNERFSNLTERIDKIAGQRPELRSVAG